MFFFVGIKSVLKVFENINDFIWKVHYNLILFNVMLMFLCARLTAASILYELNTKTIIIHFAEYGYSCHKPWGWGDETTIYALYELSCRCLWNKRTPAAHNISVTV